MITRREVALGGALTIIWGGVVCPCRGHAATPAGPVGCMLSADEAEQFLARSTAPQMFASGNETIVASSGNREFDYALARTLSQTGR